MKHILNKTDYTEIQNRIQAISVLNVRRWGKMDLPQMLAHCTMQLKLALGEIPSQPQGPGFMRSGLGRWILLSTIPWPKGAQTPKEMNADLGNVSLTDVETGKRDLLNYLRKTRAQDQLQPHPFFGELNRKEWARLVYKHLDHHLKQFGSR